MLSSTVAILDSEQEATEAIEASAREYRAAVTARCGNIIAGERYYRDLIVYQWRLDALDSTLQAAEACSSRESADLDCNAEALVRQRALESSIVDIDRQRSAAIASFEERAKDYAMTVTGKHAVRIAVNKEERHAALQRYHQIANDTFEEVKCEAHDILEVAPGDHGLKQLRLTLERRRVFWNSQLEETWAAWQNSTTKMHQTGEQAMGAWVKISSGVSDAQQVLAGSASLESLWCRCLAIAVACGLEAEILEPLGLSGLSSGCAVGKSGAGGFALECRLDLIVSMLELLRGAGALHEVGTALLRESRLGQSATSSSNPDRGSIEPVLPPLVVSMMLRALGNGDVDGAVVEDFACDDSPRDRPLAAAQRLVPWLANSLVEAMCTQVWKSDARLLRDLCQLSCLLGGARLVEAVVRAKSQQVWWNLSGSSAHELAAGRSATLQLLEQWLQLAA